MATIQIEDYDGGPLVILPVDEAPEEKESAFKQYWRPAMAILYLLLCFLDYAVRPIVNELSAKNFDLAETVAVIQNLNPSLQVTALEIASTHEKWPPILSEFVHMAFGAILTGAAITRGMEKTARAKNANTIGRRTSTPIVPKPKPTNTPKPSDRPTISPDDMAEGPEEDPKDNEES
jgi:hypothetical protein